MAAPTFIQEAEIVWNDSTANKATASFNVVANDILVAFAIAEGNPTPEDFLTIAGGSLTWTLRQSVSVLNYTLLDLWTAVVDVDKSMTVTFDDSGGSLWYGGNVLTFRASDGVGASAKENADSEAGGPSMNLTTTQDNSAIVVVLGDWNATSGTRTWRSGAGAFTEQSNFLDAAHYWAGGGYHADAGAVGTYAVGQTAPTGQKHSLVAVEIKGTVAGVPDPALIVHRRENLLLRL